MEIYEHYKSSSSCPIYHPKNWLISIYQHTTSLILLVFKVNHSVVSDSL